MKARAARVTASVCLFALVLLCLSWEFWLAPLRPGGSWLAIKVLPLIAALSGVLRGNRYTFKWSSMLILAYFVEGVVRAFTERGISAQLALSEITLSFIFFVAALSFVRTTR